MKNLLLISALMVSVCMSVNTAAQDSTTKFVTVGDLKIRVWDGGKGPAILLIHGMFGDHLDWEPVLVPLAKDHRVIAIDLPGFGESSKPHTDYSVQFFTRSIDGVLSQLKVKKVTVAGNSFGGIIAMEYALEHPERVEKLVLIDSGGLHHFTEDQEKASLDRFSEANLKLLTPQINEMMFGPLFVNGPSTERTRYIAKQDAKLSRSDFPAYTYAIHNSIKLALDTDLQGRLKDIGAPTLLINGEKDYVVQPAWVREASTRFKNAKLVMLPDCGHVPQLECAPQVIEELKKFIAVHD
jgi:pimeloyl-ACP methyl ester carboxylesterase